MSREFQSSVEQMIREAELDEMRQELKKATEFDLEKEFNKTIDPTGELAESIKPPDMPDYLPTRRRRLPSPCCRAIGSTGRRAASRHCRSPRALDALAEPQPAAAEPARAEPAQAHRPQAEPAPRRRAAETVAIARWLTDDKEDELEDGRMPLLEHLVELRNRLMWAVGAVIVAFLVCYQFKETSTLSWRTRWPRSTPAEPTAR